MTDTAKCPVCGEQLIGKPAGCAKHGFPSASTSPLSIRYINSLAGYLFRREEFDSNLLDTELINELAARKIRVQDVFDWYLKGDIESFSEERLESFVEWYKKRELK